MAFKFIVFATLVAAAKAGLLPVAQKAYHVAQAVPVAVAHAAPIGYAAPVAKVVSKSHESEPYNSHPQYSFSYEVHDSHTGDIKSQQETRDGDVVKGSYSFIEADGSRRIVHYTADAHNGFNAVVERQPAQQAPAKYAAPVYVTPAPAYAKPAHVYVKAAAPVYAKVVAPAVHSPVFKQATPIVEAPEQHYPAAVAQSSYKYSAPAAPATHGYAAPPAHSGYKYSAPAAHSSHGYAAPAPFRSYYH